MNGHIALQHGSGFSLRWAQRCDELRVPYRIVDLYKDGIGRGLAGSAALLWQLNHDDPTDLAFARNILLAAEAMGVMVFPNVATGAHFDDKVAQMQLLQAIGAPIPATEICFTLAHALHVISEARYPLVFKLRRGAGSSNVRMITSPRSARLLALRLFGLGMESGTLMGGVARAVTSNRRRHRSLLRPPAQYLRVVQRMLRNASGRQRERGYLLLQEFVPGNTHDIRVDIIGGRAFIFRRRVRAQDFRASGSGMIEYFPPGECDHQAIEICYRVAERLGTQCMGFDIVVEPKGGRHLIVEMSYVFNDKAVLDCGGYFDRELRWHGGSMWPQDAILDDILAALEKKDRKNCVCIDE